MLTIRLTRRGKKNQPFFKIVVIDKRRSSKGGRAVEQVGHVDPLTKKNSIKKDRVLHWINMGAQPSPTVHNLLVNEKIIEAPKISKFKKSKKAKASETAAAAAAAPEGTPAAEAPTKEQPAEETTATEKPAESQESPKET